MQLSVCIVAAIHKQVSVLTLQHVSEFSFNSSIAVELNLVHLRCQDVEL